MAGTTNSSQTTQVYALITFRDLDVIIDLSNDPVEIKLTTEIKYNIEINITYNALYHAQILNSPIVNLIDPPAESNIEPVELIHHVFTEKEIYPIVKYNELDEFGNRYQLKRKTEEDYLYQLKLLDVFANKSNSSFNGIINSIIRELDLFKADIGYIQYNSTVSESDKIKYSLYINDTHLYIINNEDNSRLVNIPLYYSLPNVWIPSTDYNKWDLLLLPTDTKYGLLCLSDGTTDITLTLPTNWNVGDTFINGTVQFKIVELGAYRLLTEVVDEFNEKQDVFDVVLYSYLANSFNDIYAPFILPTTNVKLKQNIKPKNLDKYIIPNTEIFNTQLFKVNASPSYNEYTIDYINGIITLGEVEDEILVSYLYNQEKIKITYMPVKILRLQEEDSINTFLYPMYKENKIINEIDLNTYEELTPAFNYPYKQLNAIINKMEDKYPLLWYNDTYTYNTLDTFEMNDDNNKTECEVQL